MDSRGEEGRKEFEEGGREGGREGEREGKREGGRYRVAVREATLEEDLLEEEYEGGEVGVEHAELLDEERRLQAVVHAAWGRGDGGRGNQR